MFKPSSDRTYRNTYFIDTLEQRVLLSGELDPTFGIGGFAQGQDASTAPTNYSAIGTQSDGKIVTAGLAPGSNGEQFYVTRFNVDGSIDLSFGTNGVTEFSSASFRDQSVSMLIEPDDEIVIAGNLADPAVADATAMDFTVIRLNADGAVDTTFGSSGSITFDGDTDPELFWQDGKVLIGSNNTLRRLNANGSLDSTFTANLPGGTLYAVQPDNKILEYFSTDDPTGLSDPTYSLGRYGTNGAVDSSFGTSGTQLLDASVDPSPTNTLVEQNGTILQLDGYALSALNANGSEDSAFGSQGSVIVQTDPDDIQGSTLLQQPDGDILVVQQFSHESYSDIQIYRYTALGQLDMSFNETGFVEVAASHGDAAADGGGYATLDNQQRLLIADGAAADIFAIETAGTLVPGPAVKMVFITQPTDQFIGTADATIALEDANGALASTDDSEVTYVINGASPVYAPQTDVISGFASTGFDFADVATDCTITASDPEVPSITSSPFNLVVPLAFVQQPTGSIEAGNLGPVVVDVLNLDGTINTASNANVSIGISDSSSNRISDTTTVAAVNGVATFDSLQESHPNTGYYLSATIGQYYPVSSGTFDIINGIPRVSFAAVPNRVTTAGALGPVTVNLIDITGNVLSSENTNVTISLAGGPTGATLEGLLNVAAVNGIATFSDLTINTVGNGYTLTATAADNGSAATTASFNIVPVTTPSPLTQSLKTVRLAGTNIAGTKLNAVIPVVITNQGSTLKGFTAINIFADSNSILDGQQVLVTTIEKNFSLKAGKKLQFNLAVKTLPATLAAGTYYLLAQLNDPNSATNVIATTQTVTVTAPFVQPVITVGNLTPLTLTGKKSGCLILTLTNNGNIPATGIEFTLSASTDSTSAGTSLYHFKSNAVVQPNGTKKFTLHIKANSLTVGSYYPFVTLTLGGVSVTAAATATFTVG